MLALTEPKNNPDQACVEMSLTSSLERIRRATKLMLSGSLSDTQSRQFATEIERIVDNLLQQVAQPSTEDSRLGRLSARERQVLSALAAGSSVQEVAHAFCRSPKTINNQRTSVLRKLGLRNTAELTRFAIQTGLAKI